MRCDGAAGLSTDSILLVLKWTVPGHYESEPQRDSGRKG